MNMLTAKEKTEYPFSLEVFLIKKIQITCKKNKVILSP